jgi:hypothetical protein
VQQLYNVNIVSHFNTVREFLPAMVAAKKGHVVTVSSMAAFVCSPGLVAYSSSKSAALVFHEGLQQELRTFHNAPEIKCSVVHPTFADTPMVAKFKDSLAKTTAKLITPESVADAVVKQVLSGRGAQIVLNGNLPYFLTTLRAWPHYLSGIILMGANRAMKVCHSLSLMMASILVILETDHTFHTGLPRDPEQAAVESLFSSQDKRPSRIGPDRHAGTPSSRGSKALQPRISAPCIYKTSVFISKLSGIYMFPPQKRQNQSIFSDDFFPPSFNVAISLHI